VATARRFCRVGDSAYVFMLVNFVTKPGGQICVTLYEWEHICERFEGATHYLEKALYKLLSQDIVPAIMTELRVSYFFMNIKV
jgi:hypothetical protein